MCQLDSGSQRRRVKESRTPDKEVRPTSLNGDTTEGLKLTEKTNSTSPVHGTREVIGVVHSAVTSEEKVSSTRSMACEVGVSHVPVPWGKLAKTIFVDAFKDVHAGLRTLGPPLYISMKPNVTPIQAHPHWCPVAKEAKASGAIRDLEKPGILKKVTEPTAWISNSVYRGKPDGSIRVCIDPSQTINKAIEGPQFFSWWVAA